MAKARKKTSGYYLSDRTRDQILDISTGLAMKEGKRFTLSVAVERAVDNLWASMFPDKDTVKAPCGNSGITASKAVEIALNEKPPSGKRTRPPFNDDGTITYSFQRINDGIYEGEPIEAKLTIFEKDRTCNGCILKDLDCENLISTWDGLWSAYSLCSTTRKFKGVAHG